MSSLSKPLIIIILYVIKRVRCAQTSLNSIFDSSDSLFFFFVLCSIESQYQNCAHLEVNCQPGVLIPNQAMQVDILFYPREARRYHEIVPFEINGLSTMNVEIFGEGTDMKVGLLTLTVTTI